MRNLLFVGSDDSRMLQDALILAREALGTDNLSVHPDYLFIEPVGKKTIGVEEVLPVVEKGINRAALAEHSVAIIHHFDAVTVQAQNKLLLTLEANENLQVIATARATSQILPTVLSRMEVREYKRAGMEQFREKFKTNAEAAYHAFGADLQLALRHSDWLAEFLQIGKDVAEGPERLLETLHLLVEKDPEAVTGDPAKSRCSLFALRYFLTERGCKLAEQGKYEKALACLDSVALLDEEEALMKKTSHSKDDYFLAVMEVIEKIKK